MDLRTGTPYWLAINSPALPNIHVLDRDETCDALVIGTGICGAMVAAHLVEAGLDVVMVDRREVMSGSTPASTALIQYDVDVPLLELAERIGIEKARDIYQINRQTLDDMLSLVDRLRIDCGMTRRPGLYLARDKNDTDFLRREAQARAKAGIEAHYLDRLDLIAHCTFDRPGGILSEIQYELDPVRLTRGLLTCAINQGVRIYDKTEILIPDSNVAHVPPMTSAGLKIHCRNVVFATGYETPELFSSIRNLCRLHSTFAIASQSFDKIDVWRDRILIWEHANPYLYGRWTSDNRLLVGGEDVPFKNAVARDALIPAKSAAIVSKFNKLYPGLHIDPQFAWAGTFAVTDDGLPLIGQPDPTHPAFFALGFGGNGITYSLLAGRIMRDLILKNSTRLCSLYSFERHF